jgi:hypothetical protein
MVLGTPARSAGREGTTIVDDQGNDHPAAGRRRLGSHRNFRDP